jgi:hypothetical protein
MRMFHLISACMRDYRDWNFNSSRHEVKNVYVNKDFYVSRGWIKFLRRHPGRLHTSVTGRFVKKRPISPKMESE